MTVKPICKSMLLTLVAIHYTTIKPTTWHACMTSWRFNWHRTVVGCRPVVRHVAYNKVMLSKSHLRRVKKLPLAWESNTCMEETRNGATTMEKHLQDTWCKKSKHPFTRATRQLVLFVWGCRLHVNLIPRVLRLFRQRLVARRDSGVLEVYYRRISAVKQWKRLHSWNRAANQKI